jgi:hypothetical protein
VGSGRADSTPPFPCVTDQDGIAVLVALLGPESLLSELLEARGLGQDHSSIPSFMGILTSRSAATCSARS